MNIEALSLDQIRVALAVVETGSFSGAARRYNRAQSAVSYAIQTLENQLGVALFDRSGPRPTLTDAGKVLLTDMRAVLMRADGLRTHARTLAMGLEPEVGVVVDAMYPLDELSAVLTEFHAAFPTVALRVHIEVLGAVPQLILEGNCDVGVLASLPELVAGITTYAMGTVALRPVAAPVHPLAQIGRPITMAELEGHLQIVLSERSRLTEGRDFNVLSPRTWRVTDLAAKLACLRAGLGWGTMPAHLIHDDLRRGVLSLLRLEGIPLDGDARPIFAIHRTDRNLGPAGSWLLDRLRGGETAAPAQWPVEPGADQEAASVHLP